MLIMQLKLFTAFQELFGMESRDPKRFTLLVLIDPNHQGMCIHVAQMDFAKKPFHQ